jgi:hypothetical protein
MVVDFVKLCGPDTIVTGGGVRFGECMGLTTNAVADAKTGLLLARRLWSSGLRV